MLSIVILIGNIALCNNLIDEYWNSKTTFVGNRWYLSSAWHSSWSVVKHYDAHLILWMRTQRSVLRGCSWYHSLWLLLSSYQFFLLFRKIWSGVNSKAAWNCLLWKFKCWYFSPNKQNNIVNEKHCNLNICMPIWI